MIEDFIELILDFNMGYYDSLKTSLNQYGGLKI